ncbi:hypothetical protein [Trinickia sp. Y13]|uniref:hypothetical protein n=1 Tax=Trinickia sp. Y13 TaxID=2917807 RepID=UPI0024055036|nr:hypothetical protein [Trinickia sp. Y13]MDG0023708.1 hypothetical protein [Trinickia sp. Y13]
MITQSTLSTRERRVAVCCRGAGKVECATAQPGQPAPQQPSPNPDTEPRGEPKAPSDKPLPDLPNPTEIGEDG